MARSAFAGLALANVAMLLACMQWEGRPPLGIFIVLVFSIFFAVGMGVFYDGTTLNLSVGFLVAGISSFILAELAARGETETPVEAVR